ncbi:MAG: hypothetical protein AVDCRST_MAG66-1363, partial [uncultured Pseudonocardia sp.]
DLLRDPHGGPAQRAAPRPPPVPGRQRALLPGLRRVGRADLRRPRGHPPRHPRLRLPGLGGGAPGRGEGARPARDPVPVVAPAHRAGLRRIPLRHPPRARRAPGAAGPAELRPRHDRSAGDAGRVPGPPAPVSGRM